MKLLYDMPIGMAEPHYAQIIKADKLKAFEVYPDAGITVTAPRVVVEGNRLRDVLFGIFVAQTENAVIRGNEVTSKDEYDVGGKGDGLRLWYSPGALIEGNAVSATRDVVIWYSSDVTLRDNLVQDGRYGVHLMYCDRITMEHNRLVNNSVGIYTMYSSGTWVRENVIRGRSSRCGRKARSRRPTGGPWSMTSTPGAAG